MNWIILSAESESSRVAAIEFKRKHTTNITYNTVAKLMLYFSNALKLLEGSRSGYEQDRVVGQFFKPNLIVLNSVFYFS